MSEKTNTPQAEVQLPILSEIIVQPERGAVDLGRLAVGYHNAAGTFATWRKNRAAERIERLERKDELYEGLGHMAINHGFNGAPAPPENTPRPQTFAERHMDRRIGKRRAEKKLIADIRAKRVAKIHGTSDIGSLKGVTSFDRTKAKIGVMKQAHRGELTAQEARKERLRINAEPVKLGIKSLKHANKQQRKTTRRLSRAANQPVASRWRSWRTGRAQEIQAEQSEKARKHREKI